MTDPQTDTDATQTTQTNGGIFGGSEDIFENTDMFEPVVKDDAKDDVKQEPTNLTGIDQTNITSEDLQTKKNEVLDPVVNESPNENAVEETENTSEVNPTILSPENINTTTSPSDQTDNIIPDKLEETSSNPIAEVDPTNINLEDLDIVDNTTEDIVKVEEVTQTSEPKPEIIVEEDAQDKKTEEINEPVDPLADFDEYVESGTDNATDTTIKTNDPISTKSTGELEPIETIIEQTEELSKESIESLEKNEKQTNEGIVNSKAEQNIISENVQITEDEIQTTETDIGPIIPTPIEEKEKDKASGKSPLQNKFYVLIFAIKDIYKAQELVDKESFELTGSDNEDFKTNYTFQLGFNHITIQKQLENKKDTSSQEHNLEIILNKDEKNLQVIINKEVLYDEKEDLNTGNKKEVQVQEKLDKFIFLINEYKNTLTQNQKKEQKQKLKGVFNEF